MWRYDTKCKYMLMFSLENLARKGLIKITTFQFQWLHAHWKGTPYFNLKFGQYRYHHWTYIASISIFSLCYMNVFNKDQWPPCWLCWFLAGGLESLECTAVARITKPFTRTSQPQIAGDYPHCWLAQIEMTAYMARAQGVSAKRDVPSSP